MQVLNIYSYSSKKEPVNACFEGNHGLFFVCSQIQRANRRRISRSTSANSTDSTDKASENISTPAR